MIHSVLQCHACGSNLFHDITARPLPDSPQTNDPPSTAEASRIQAELPLLQNEIQILHTRIDQLKAALNLLESRKFAATKALEEQRAILHPIRRLPLELLQEIFELYTDHDPWVARDLSLVSKRWREVSISFPGIWSSIDMHGRKLNRKALQLILQRSASALLDITLFSSEEFIHPSHPVIDILFPSSPRWRSLHLDLLHIEAVMPLRGRFDSLEKLVVCFSEPREYDSPLTMFEIAPALRAVSVFHQELPYERILTSPHLQLPWPTINEYYKSSIVPWVASQLDFLPLCQNLTVVRLEITLPATEQIITSFTLPKLRKLHICAYSRPGTLAGLVDKMTLPALTSLYLANFAYNEERLSWNEADQNCLESLVSRSQCSLTSLGLEALKSIWPSFLVFLARVSTITQFQAVNCSINAISSILDCSEAALILLPNLKQLELSSMTISTPLLTLLAMLQSRCPPLGSEEPCARLELVRLSEMQQRGRSAQKLLGDTLSTLRNRGLRICVDNVQEM
ncbi:hypothetical protein C8J56DRAFT_832536 [Mycena floridula]|nr:hypothetical protein C8J56DRAFT_1169377 [Mycena floridula]KAJ7582399.1 hypothetical protein C8J56DRAFT_832536 [Mycena floridula]